MCKINPEYRFCLQHPFFEMLDQDDDDDDDDVDPEGPPTLLKISDADGSLDMEEVKTGDISPDDLSSQVYCVILPHSCHSVHPVSVLCTSISRYGIGGIVT